LADFDGLAVAEVVWDEATTSEAPEELLRAAQAGWDAVRVRPTGLRGVASIDRPT